MSDLEQKNNALDSSSKEIEETMDKAFVEKKLKALEAKLDTFETNEHGRSKKLEEDLNRTVSRRIDDAKTILEAELRRDFLSILERKLQEEGSADDGHAHIRARFFPLIEVTIQQVIEELDFKGQFEKILLKELEDKKHFATLLIKELKEERRFESILGDLTQQYSKLNEKVGVLSSIVEDMRQKSVSTIEELSEQVRQIITRLDDNSNLSVNISNRLYEIQSARDLTVEQIQQSYREIIDIIEGEKEIIDRDGMIRAFEPLVKSLLETELDEKGRFVKLLAEKISEISSEKASTEFQKHFRTLVDTIVGKGTQKNEKMARENTELGLRRMSDVDVDEILGKKILKIVDNRSVFGETLAGLGDKIDNLSKGQHDNKVKQFFDGLSLSVFYFECIKDNKTISIKKEHYPKDIENFTSYLNSFKAIIAEEEEAYNQNPTFYTNYTKTTSKTVVNNAKETTEQNFLEAYLYMSYLNESRIYFFCSQEPSNLFKKKAKALLENEDFEPLEKEINSLVETYTIPKVDIAVFNSDGFELPSENDTSVVSIKDGDKYLERPEEIELLEVLNGFSNKNSKTVKKSFFNNWFGAKNKTGYEAGSKGLWYYWAESYPAKKYLAVKMLEAFPIDDEGKTERNFTNYVQKEIWTRLVASRNLAEMQEWVDTFIQKDAGLLADSSPIIFKILKYFQYIPIFILFILIAWLYYNPIINIEEQLNQHGLLHQQISTKSNESFNQIQDSLKTQSELLSKLDTNFIGKQTVFSLAMLIDSTNLPFEFAPQSKLERIDLEQQLSISDQNRLKKIANLFDGSKHGNLSKDEWQINIIKYKNPQDKDIEHNEKRAQLIKGFLVKQNSSLVNSITILDDIDTSKELYGVQLVPTKK